MLWCAGNISSFHFFVYFRLSCLIFMFWCFWSLCDSALFQCCVNTGYLSCYWTHVLCFVMMSWLIVAVGLAASHPCYLTQQLHFLPVSSTLTQQVKLRAPPSYHLPFGPHRCPNILFKILKFPSDPLSVCQSFYVSCCESAELTVKKLDLSCFNSLRRSCCENG